MQLRGSVLIVVLLEELARVLVLCAIELCIANWVAHSRKVLDQKEAITRWCMCLW